MLLKMLKGKIHRAVVTNANVNYNGSIKIDKDLMEQAGIKPYELVHVNNLSNAAHWETYVIPGDRGEICLNGPPARLFTPGDKIVINCFCYCTPEEAEKIEPKIVIVN